MHPWRGRAPFHPDGWVYERTEDGWRMLAFKDSGRVRLASRRGVDHTAPFARLAAAISKLPAPALVLDGEVCVFDANLISQLHLPDDESHGQPAVFVAFDCVYAPGSDFRARPLRDRRARLEDEIAGAALVFPSPRLDAMVTTPGPR